MVPRDSQKRPNWTLKSTLGDHKDVKNGEKCNLKKHTRKYNEKVQESYPPKPQKVWFRVHETRVFQNRLVQKKLPKLCQNGIRNHSTELESTFLIFLQILYRLGKPFGNHFGAESDEKHIQKCIRKSTPEKYIKICPK